MPRITANSIDFEYDEIGPKDGEPVLLIMGFSVQMTRWPDPFRKGLADAGYRVIRFDNRDIGLSHQFDNFGLPDIAKIMETLLSGGDASGLAPYTLDSMADDVAGIIEALDLGPTHLIGASMGGMILQLTALRYPHLVRSLVPIMTTSGDPTLPQASTEAMAALTTPPASTDRSDVVAAGVKAQRVIGSDASLTRSDEDLAQSIGESFDRAYRPMGVMRQYAAILSQPRWHERLGEVDAPTLVLHGAIDPLIPPAGGEDIAKRIPDARFIALDKWGHDVPPGIVAPLVEHITGFLAKTSEKRPVSTPAQ